MEAKPNYRQVIANNLIYLMKENDVSRKDLCAKTNIKYTTLCDWINGRTYPRLDALEQVAGYFALDLPDMFIDLEHSTDAQSRLLAYGRRLSMEKKEDYTNTYPEGFFEFFSHSHDIDFEEPEDLPAEEPDLT